MQPIQGSTADIQRIQTKIVHMKTYKQQLVATKSARAGITEQRPIAQRARTKRRTVTLRALLPPMLGWTEPQWDSAGKYFDQETAKLRANALASNHVIYKQAISWTIDGELYIPATQDKDTEC